MTEDQLGFDPKQLTLELTESVLMRKDGRALDVLREVGRMGIGVALDDFGTGFSSLSYLKAIPVDTIKIDQFFVRDLTIDRDDGAIVATTPTVAIRSRSTRSGS